MLLPQVVLLQVDSQLLLSKERPPGGTVASTRSICVVRYNDEQNKQCFRIQEKGILCLVFCLKLIVFVLFFF